MRSLRMIIKALKIKNFRNLDDIYFEPTGSINVISGENAQGKTNLLESIWLFSGARSFRGAKDSDMLGLGKPYYKNEVIFDSGDREQKTQIGFVPPKKSISLNGIDLRSGSELFGIFPAVIFTPADLSIIDGGPSERRKFLDNALTQLKPGYGSLISRYIKTLMQRNSLLKDLIRHSELYDTLDIWDDRLSVLGGRIVRQRVLYIRNLDPYLKKIYDGISSSREEITAEYQSSFGSGSDDEAENASALRKNLYDTREEDIKNGTTGSGPHRDDIAISLSGLNTRIYASQGQKRSCAVALKLSEAELTGCMTGTPPVILLDDVMSELDPLRRDYILNHIENRQVFLTCCEPEEILAKTSAEVFRMKEGKICTFI
jgi:DNA replication and repair protein RecF